MRALNTINGNISGTASNVTGTVAIANGGTGSTTRLGAAQNLTNEAVSSPGYVVGLTSSWGKFGYTTIDQLKTTIGSAAAASGGTGITMVTTGEKYTWNNKSNLTIGTTSSTALAGDTKYAGASTAGGAATSAAKLTNTSKIGDTNKPVYFTASGVPSAISYTIDKSVPSTAVFTDANVTQTATDSTDSDYELLFSSTADNTTRTEGARKTSGLKFNPNGRNITLTARAVASNYCSFYPTSISFNSEKRSSSFSDSTMYLDYINGTDHRRMDFTPYGNSFSPCIEISADDTSGTNFRYMYYTDSDIFIYSGGNMVTTWDGTNTSLKSAIGNKISDIKLVRVNIACTSLTTNMSLNTYVTNSLPSGYTFLCWQTMGCSNGWAMSFPIYMSNVLGSSGNPWWTGSLNTNTGCSVDFYYFCYKK